MNLKNKTDKQLWDMLDELNKLDKKKSIIRFEIHQEIIRREKRVV